jgi:polyhydroxyalkanoate synthesis regulator phasin
MEPWKEYQQQSTPWKEYQPQGFVGNVNKDLQGRGAELANAINAYSTGQQGLTQTAIQAIGKSGAGAINDILGQGLSTITPEVVKSGLMSVAQPILNSQPVQSMVKGYGEFAQSNPNAARTLESLGNIASMLPITKGGQVAGQAVTTVAKPVVETAGELAMKTIAPNIAPEAAPLAQRAVDFGIPLSLDQVAPSRVRNTIQKVSQELPFSGVENFQDQQIKNWNKALAKEALGVDAENLNPTVIGKYLKKADEDFSSILNNKTLNITDTEPLDNIINNAAYEAAPDTIKIVEKNVNQLKNLISKGEISGNQLASVRSDLVKRSGRVQGELKNYLGDIVDYIDNNIDLVAISQL